MASTGQAHLGFLDDLVRCETRLYNALNDRLRERHGIVMSQFEALHLIRTSPRCRVADLAGAVAAGVGAISKGVDRLEAKGWVRRLPNPADRRSSLLLLTETGEQLVADARHTCEQRLAELLDITPEELAATTRTLSKLRRSLEAGQVGVPVG
ncbi:MarR family winged helix-turn-helix transcriptional regulator [Winogradskya consettensis]|uniref:Transcriptional regulator n=1 Tax=Winogradskya consettensis TaxID=113560 RepID=A0A919SYS8_9ACTN|nr:MarR family transcriptional regulator [Actinoplanes consettensis]GIM80962.1 transcriptional regulator [Actinoplanes consettensis]